ncbi:MAG: helix-turn-helix domain-containing protein [Chloroflexota bacterium]
MNAILVEMGSRLRQLRQRRSVSQSELARRTGAARTYIVAVEQGQHEPSIELLRRCAAALGYTLTEVVREAAGEPFSVPTLRFGARIRLRRERLGFSAAQIAARAGTTRATVYQIEGGINTNPGLALLARLARALHCCPSELVPELPPALPPAPARDG